MAEQLSNNASSTVVSGLANVTNPVTFVVASAGGFPTTGNFRIIVEAEILLVTAVTGTSFTASRAQEGTSAASHANGKVVTHVITAGGLHELIATQLLAGITVDGTGINVYGAGVTISDSVTGLYMANATSGQAPYIALHNNTVQAANITMNGTAFAIFNVAFAQVFSVNLATGQIQIIDTTKAFPSVQTVTFGANDSGGAGFKLLRIPN